MDGTKILFHLSSSVQGCAWKEKASRRVLPLRVVPDASDGGVEFGGMAAFSGDKRSIEVDSGREASHTAVGAVFADVCGL